MAKPNLRLEKVTNLLNSDNFIKNVNDDTTNKLFLVQGKSAVFYFAKIDKIRDKTVTLGTKVTVSIGEFYHVDCMGVLVGYIWIIPDEYDSNKTINFVRAFKKGKVYNIVDTHIVLSNEHILLISSSVKNKYTDDGMLLIMKGTSFINIKKLIGK